MTTIPLFKTLTKVFKPGKQFYHGTTMPGLTLLKPGNALETTPFQVSDGFAGFVAPKFSATGYANYRAKQRNGSANIYSVDIGNQSFFDARILNNMGSARFVRTTDGKVLRQPLIQHLLDSNSLYKKQFAKDFLTDIRCLSSKLLDYLPEWNHLHLPNLKSPDEADIFKRHLDFYRSQLTDLTEATPDKTFKVGQFYTLYQSPSGKGDRTRLPIISSFLNTQSEYRGLIRQTASDWRPENMYASGYTLPKLDTEIALFQPMSTTLVT
jgi:hypothetical protein